MRPGGLEANHAPIETGEYEKAIARYQENLINYPRTPSAIASWSCEVTETVACACACAMDRHPTASVPMCFSSQTTLGTPCWRK